MDLTDQLTPVMGRDDRQKSQELSMRRSRPPLKVPGYEQEQFIGRGAFGEVWSAVSSNSGRRVAIKFYSHRGSLDWSNMAREVEKLRFLFADRYVVQLFEVGWESDPPYFVMEYMPLGSLADRLQQGSLTVEEAVRIIREIATGLVHAHGRGVLHCDLKPSNIMLDEDGRPRLADFGQARLTHERAPSLGTFFYMAPEQADPQALPDVRWDVYSLGAILYQLLTAKAPYESPQLVAELANQETLYDKLAAYRRHLETARKSSEHRRLSGVDPALATIVRRCLAIDPEHRYANVQEVLNALNQRDRQRAQRPLIQLGALGPAAVMVVMAAVSFAIFHLIMSAAEGQLIARTLESNRFAARMVAARFALEIEKRWRCLEHESSARTVQLALEEPNRSTSGDSESSALQSWLEGRHRYWNTQFSAKTPASYWFVLDRQGYLQAISPPKPELVGRYFGYRDYFHGRGGDLEKGQSHGPLGAPHRSNVYLSQPENVLSVAFSVPIHKVASVPQEVLGVLVMEADLGHFAEFAGARHQFAAIVDRRPDETGKEGSIVEHPELHGRKSEGLRRYVSRQVLDDLKEFSSQYRDSLRGSPNDVGDDKLGPAGNGQFESYRDPFDSEPDDPWLCSAQPALIVRGNGAAVDTGWTVLVQERRREVLLPLHRLWRSIVLGGLAAVGLVVLVLTVLWIYVLCRLSEERGARRFLKHLVGMAESLRSTGSLTLPSDAAAQPQGKVSEQHG